MDPILTLSPEGVVKDVNRATELILDISRDNLVGREVVRFFEDQQLARETLHLVVEQGCITDCRLALRSGAGRLIQTAFSATVYRDDAGKVESIIVYVRDITEQLRQESELRHLVRIVEGSDDAIISMQIDGVISSWNKGAELIYGFRREEMIGNSITALRLPDQKHVVLDLFARLAQGESIDAYEAEHVRKDNQRVFVSIRMSPMKDSKGQVRGIAAIIRDISKEKALSQALIAERNSISLANEVLGRQAAELARQAAQMERLAEMASLLQVCETDDEVYFVIAQFASKLFPDSDGALYVPGNPKNILERAVHWGELDLETESFASSDCLAAHRAQTQIYTKFKQSEHCKHIHSPDGSFLCAPVVLRGELLGLMSVHWKTREVISDEEALTVRVLGDAALALSNLRLRQKLRELSIRDPLTGLFNRRYMEEFFTQELIRSQRQERSLSLLVFDIDHFKRFNDTYGHEAGDAVLHDLGAFLRKHVRGSDVICRYGGEEIIILLPESPLDTAVGRAERIRKDVKEIQVESLGKILPPVTLSIGVSAYPDHGNSIEEIFRAADTALYKAKQDGRDRVCVAATNGVSEELSVLAPIVPPSIPTPHNGDAKEEKIAEVSVTGASAESDKS